MEDDRGFGGGRGEKSRGRGGRRRDRGYRERSQRGKAESSAQPPMKTPTILTKAPGEKNQDSPIKLLLKSRELPSEEKMPPIATSLPSNLLTMLTKPPREEQHTAQGGEEKGVIGAPGTISIQGIQRNTTSTVSGSLSEGLSSNLASLKISGVDKEISLQSVKMLDDSLHWTDAALDILADQTDFLVVGVIGLQGAGKSTILSMLAGATPRTDPRSYLFDPQSKATQEAGSHQSNGVNIAVTSERVLLLDTQPLLSPSILDHLIHYDRSIPSEYSTPENYHEMQSLQIVTFLLTVCHVILVVQDWFTDVNLLRLLRSAEMLKPSSVPHSHESSGSSASDNAEDHYPEVVFVYNKATREDYEPENVSAMHAVTTSLFQHSRLKLHSGLSLVGSGLLPYSSLMSCDNINIHLIPAYEGQTNGHHSGNGIMPSYKGFPSFELVLQALRNQVFSTHRHPLTQHTLTEKNWFHHAARSWETIRKSSLITEYNRLLSS
ncbi:protein SMG9-like [Actinia tenebrosa]|uniref:Protein SMG9-like n=1 Tax=Actinia tenebrosa TaxID=6105 RepID=A0A6P8I3P8_ACTTE|nr:protein SMG9-like [Actinia tenebrosa]